MRHLVFDELQRVSGATYGVCTIDDYYDYTGPSMVQVNYNYQSPMLILYDSLNAALFGCGAALLSGRGTMGCVIGGGAAAGAKAMSYFIQDAYWMYQEAKA